RLADAGQAVARQPPPGDLPLAEKAVLGRDIRGPVARLRVSRRKSGRPRSGARSGSRLIWTPRGTPGKLSRAGLGRPWRCRRRLPTRGAENGLQHTLLNQGVAMDTQDMTGHPVTRRAFLGGAATLAAWAILPRGVRGADAARPNSVFHGVRIGCIT